MTLRLLLPGGAELEVLEPDAERVLLRSPAAHPPGAPLTGTADGLTWQLKVKRCRSVQDERGAAFLVEARWVNLSRRHREALARARGAGGAHEPG